MSTQTSNKYFQANSVGEVQGPVGMDKGIWLEFDTDQGTLRLKLSHEDAIELEDKLKAEDSIAAPPRQTVTETADALLELAAEMDRKQEASIAGQLESCANDLRLAVRRMPHED